MDFLAMAGPGSLPVRGLTDLGYGIVEMAVYGAIGFALIGIVITCRHCLLECRKWRRSQGRAVFWPLIH